MKTLFLVTIASLLALAVNCNDNEVNSTHTVFPTEIATKKIEDETTSKEVTVTIRSFNTSGSEVPYINCSRSAAKNIAAATTWTWANGSNFIADTGVINERYPTTGTMDQGAVTMQLKFVGFATGAANYVGNYTCKMAGSVSNSTVQSAPVVKMSEKDYRSVMEGDKLTQACTVIAYPIPVVTWWKNGVILAADGERITFGADNRTITITELKKEDAGVYVCSANNTLGVGESYIKLRVKDRLAALWPFLGIVAEVIILVTIILLYEKKRAAQKRNQENEDAAEVKDERNANDSDVRHRAVKT